MLRGFLVWVRTALLFCGSPTSLVSWSAVEQAVWVTAQRESCILFQSRTHDAVQWSMEQTCLAGPSIVNVIIGRMRQCCRGDSVSPSHPFSLNCVLLSSGLIFNQPLHRALSGMVTESAERGGCSCGHAKRRHHNGRWPILCCYLLHTQGSLTGKTLSSDGMDWAYAVSQGGALNLPPHF